MFLLISERSSDCWGRLPGKAAGPPAGNIGAERTAARVFVGCVGPEIVELCDRNAFLDFVAFRRATLLMRCSKDGLIFGKMLGRSAGSMSRNSLVWK